MVGFFCKNQDFGKIAAFCQYFYFGHHNLQMFSLSDALHCSENRSVDFLTINKLLFLAGNGRFLFVPHSGFCFCSSQSM